MMQVKFLADSINDDCERKDYFFASGCIKESLQLWQKRENYDLLCKDAQIMVDKYLPHNNTLFMKAIKKEAGY